MNNVLEGQHHALGPSGCAGGIEKDCGILQLSVGNFIGEKIGGTFLRFPSLRLDVIVEINVFFGVMAQTPIIFIDDCFQSRQPVDDRQQLVDLFLILDNSITRLGMFQDILHLFGN